MRKVGIVLSLTILLFPAFVLADCVDLGRVTSWYLESSHTIVFYMGETSLARLEIPNCEISPLSSIRLIKSYVCDLDEMMIDGVACHIITVNGSDWKSILGSRAPLTEMDSSNPKPGYG